MKRKQFVAHPLNLRAHFWARAVRFYLFRVHFFVMPMTSGGFEGAFPAQPENLSVRCRVPPVARVGTVFPQPFTLMMILAVVVLMLAAGWWHLSHPVLPQHTHGERLFCEILRGSFLRGSAREGILRKETITHLDSPRHL